MAYITALNFEKFRITKINPRFLWLIPLLLWSDGGAGRYSCIENIEILGNS